MHLHSKSRQNPTRCWVRITTCVISAIESSPSMPPGSRWFQAELRTEADGLVVRLSGWTRNRSVAFEVAEQWLSEQDSFVETGTDDVAIESGSFLMGERRAGDIPDLKLILRFARIERLAVVLVVLFLAIMLSAIVFMAFM